MSPGIGHKREGYERAWYSVCYSGRGGFIFRDTFQVYSALRRAAREAAAHMRQ